MGERHQIAPEGVFTLRCGELYGSAEQGQTAALHPSQIRAMSKAVFIAGGRGQISKHAARAELATLKKMARYIEESGEPVAGARIELPIPIANKAAAQRRRQRSLVKASRKANRPKKKRRR